MEFLIVTGMSGSGKSSVVNILEDIGYYCVDNIPPQLIPKIAEICKDNEAINKVALVTDIRGGTMFLELGGFLDELRAIARVVRVLYLDAGGDVIRTRYKETRRKHPLHEIAGGNLDKAIAAEAEILKPVRELADYVLNTSQLTAGTLKGNILSLFLDDISDSMAVSCMSFGYKYGIPAEADLMLDVRFLPNPYYVPALKERTGLDPEVQDYIMRSGCSLEFEEKLHRMLDFMLPEYVREGKSQLTIAFGCTGGRHRSVTLAERFCAYARNKGYKASVWHRDITK